MLQTLRNLFRPDEGATAVEYGIMVALIAAVIVGVVIVLGNQVNEGFCDTADSLAGATGVANDAGNCTPAPASS